MELEKLTKTQIVLLTLFVSFITSIATGITTVTLMDQAPPGITNTISKVVQTTIERVVPDKTQGATAVKTVVVKEEDLIANAVENNKQSHVYLSLSVTEKKKEGEQEDVLKEGAFVAEGFIVSGDGLIVADSALVADKESLVATLSDGTIVPVQVAIRDEAKGIVLLTLLRSEKEITHVNLVNSDNVKLGEVVVTLGGTDNLRILTGIISRLDMKTDVVPKLGDNVTKGETEELTYLSAINTNLVLTSKDSGSMLFDTDGKVVGMNIVRDDFSFAVPSNMIKALIMTLAEQPKNETVQ
ncbi:MAG: S1C family serine protease [Candidatus Yonathbacteria bacterium]|nr:S1C family serine protease [Candidatus Yonathbacteria bacterium]